MDVQTVRRLSKEVEADPQGNANNVPRLLGLLSSHIAHPEV
jgi:hypothetical protein